MSTNHNPFRDEDISSYVQDVIESDEGEKEQDEVEEEPVAPRKLAELDKPFTGRPKPTPRVLPNCEICGEKGHGVHYGVLTCDSCNNFFRQAVSLQLDNRCSEHKKCVIQKRNDCPYCLYQKCLDKGMTTDAPEGRLLKESPVLEIGNENETMEPAPDRQYGYDALEPIQEVETYDTWEPAQELPAEHDRWEPEQQLSAQHDTWEPDQDFPTEPNTWQQHQEFPTGSDTWPPNQDSPAELDTWQPNEQFQAEPDSWEPAQQVSAESNTWDTSQEFDVVESDKVDEEPVVHRTLAKFKKSVGGRPKRAPRVLPKCEICGGEGHAVHYNVVACTKCKDFFRRNIQKPGAYRCDEQKKCEINRNTRKCCQYCRFQKCLDKGMTPGAPEGRLLKESPVQELGNENDMMEPAPDRQDGYDILDPTEEIEDEGDTWESHQNFPAEPNAWQQNQKFQAEPDSWEPAQQSSVESDACQPNQKSPAESAIWQQNQEDPSDIRNPDQQFPAKWETAQEFDVVKSDEIEEEPVAPRKLAKLDEPSTGHPKRAPKVLPNCEICGDKRHGVHYGVVACKACKNFFRKNIHPPRKYSCIKQKKCVINRYTRNLCQYCRLQTCLDKGMTPGVPKRRSRREPVRELGNENMEPVPHQQYGYDTLEPIQEGGYESAERDRWEPEQEYPAQPDTWQPDQQFPAEPDSWKPGQQVSVESDAWQQDQEFPAESDKWGPNQFPNQEYSSELDIRNPDQEFPAESNTCKTAQEFDVVESAKVEEESVVPRKLSKLDESSTGHSKRAPRVLPNCKICGDKGHGVHYGVVACKTCRNFFHENIHVPKEDRCIKQNKCAMECNVRNFCRNCRLQACFDKGMTRGVPKSDEVEEEPLVPRKLAKLDESSTGLPKRVPRVLPNCEVCGDRGHGVHYGVVACKTCKKFFRNNMHQPRKYSCIKQKKCVINRNTRNCCQYCRFQKCLDKGMTPGASRRRLPVQEFPSGSDTWQPNEQFQAESDAWQTVEQFPDEPDTWQPNEEFPAQPDTWQTVEQFPDEPDTWEPDQQYPAESYTREPNQKYPDQPDTWEPAQEFSTGPNPWQPNENFPVDPNAYESDQECTAQSDTWQPNEPDQQFQAEPDIWKAAHEFSDGPATWGPAQASTDELVMEQPAHDNAFAHDIGEKQQAVSQDEPRRPHPNQEKLRAQFVAETVELHERTCAHTENKMRNRVVQPLYFMTVPDPGQNHLNAWQIYIPKFMEEMDDVVKFHRGLRFINEFPQKDLLILMRKSMFILIFLRNHRALSNQGLVLRTGQLIDLELLRILYGNLADEMINVANDINGLKLSDTELAVFMVIVMVQQLTEEYRIAHNVELSRSSNLFYEECRYLLVSKMTDGSGGLDRFNRLMEMVRALHQIDEMHSKTVNEVIKECSPLFVFPELFQEIFEHKINIENQENQPPPHQPHLAYQP